VIPRQAEPLYIGKGLPVDLPLIPMPVYAQNPADARGCMTVSRLPPDLSFWKMSDHNGVPLHAFRYRRDPKIVQLRDNVSGYLRGAD
jgi:hypothetical protein